MLLDPVLTFRSPVVFKGKVYKLDKVVHLLGMYSPHQLVGEVANMVDY